jgi:hypothetical protein
MFWVMMVTWIGLAALLRAAKVNDAMARPTRAPMDKIDGISLLPSSIPQRLGG